jgi:hypothetical protein
MIPSVARLQNRKKNNAEDAESAEFAEEEKRNPKSAGFKDQRYIEELREEEREGRSAILSLSSAAAPLGTRFIAERRYRSGISDVDPHPARLNPKAQRWPLRPLWLNLALCGSPVYRRGAKSEERRRTILISSFEVGFRYWV